MAIYSRGVSLITLSANSCGLELRTTTQDRISLLEFSLFINASSGATNEYGLGRPSIAGINPVLTPSVVEDTTIALTGTAGIALSWDTAPLKPAQFFRTSVSSNSVGSSITWMFPNGLNITPTNSLVLWNVVANGGAEVYLVWDE